MAKVTKRKQVTENYRRTKILKTAEVQVNNKNVLQELQVPSIPKQAGVVLVCGQGDVGQLGLGPDVTEKMKPFPIPNLKDVVSIAAGGMHSICLTKNGEVYSFGCNDEGALGRITESEGPDDKLESLPIKVNLPSKAVRISAGDSHSCALLEDGTLYAWGTFRDSHGTLGLVKEDTISNVPIHIKHSKKIVKVNSGADHIILLDSLGDVYTCGCAEQGQLGRINIRSCDRYYSRNGCSSFLSLKKIEPDIRLSRLKFDDIWAGTYGSFVKVAGSTDIYVFGLNNYCQMGLPEETVISYFPQMSATWSRDIGWKKFSSGQHHTLAVNSQGECYVMGRYEYGRLGLGNITHDAQDATEIPAMKGRKCIDISCGNSSSFAVTADGDIYSWGMGGNGDLGSGNEEDIYTPTKVTGKHIEGKKVVAVSGGGQHSMILVV